MNPVLLDVNGVTTFPEIGADGVSRPVSFLVDQDTWDQARKVGWARWRHEGKHVPVWKFYPDEMTTEQAKAKFLQESQE